MNEVKHSQGRSAVVLGMFDGLHNGHRAVLKSALDSGFAPVAVTFDRLPKNGGMLMSADLRKNKLSDIGFEKVVMLNFENVRQMPPLTFLEFIRDAFDPALLCCGFNYRFGVNACAGTDVMKDFCNINGIGLSISPPVKDETGEVVSSSRIREMIVSGEIERANSHMMCPFTVEGVVEKGDGRGAGLGFATVNIKMPEWLTVPRFGVYGSSVVIGHKVYKAITDIGHRPTFPSDDIVCETHIFDFNGDLYGKSVAVRLEKFIRPEQKFSSAAKLAEAIRNDIKTLEQEK